MTTRVTLNDYIDEQSSQLKSTFRRSLFKSCTNKVPLASFARRILDSYHIPVVPDQVSIPVLGTLALLREIVLPLSKKKNTKGADTGFWTAVEERLQKLYEEHGNKDRLTDEKWLDWARQIIEKDQRKFPARGAELPPMSRDEVSETVGMDATEVPDEESGFEEPNPNDIDEDDALDLEGLAAEGEKGHSDHDEDDYDGDVNLDRMGDIGSTA
ncbi:hypothetical protein TRAPUB_4101 [Trametes pubescens]|uniref:Uncharacterized protein n=1 Tax=Trametes pubescens TaxID=154538 RepID=A0A1M2VC34_TRAPU|nr:hypothetical protein TRAPUB_4101 [Trametes pubescens]